MNLVQLLEMNARKYGNKDCLRYNKQGYSYHWLSDNAEKAAAALQALGIKKGDKVSLMSRNLPIFFPVFYGILKAGATVVPINHKLMAPEIDYILEHSESKILLFDGTLNEVVKRTNSSIHKMALETPSDIYQLFDLSMAKYNAFQPIEISDDDIAEILYTSGTTGKPKGCQHAHKNIIGSGITGALAMKMDSKDRLLMAMPIWHSSPLNNWFMGIQYTGGTTILVPEYHPLHFLESIQNEKCTIYFGAPISYILPIQMIPHFDTFDLSSIRCWIYGGGPMSAETARMVMEKYKSGNFYQVYGMTEAGPTGTVLFPDEQVAKAGSIGCNALPGADLQIVTLENTIAGPGEIGEIWLRADSMMQGYLNNPEATSSCFSEKWYRTGDMARIDKDGYLFIVDRIKDMIVTGGENVYSKEVEDAIMEYPDVMESAVIGVPHPDWGETVTAMIVPKQNKTIQPNQISDFLSTRLAKYKGP